MKLILKRVDVDSTDAEELSFSEGRYIIGRDKFIDCTDVRISRTHGSIEIFSDGKVVLKALHPNPCYYYDANGLSNVTIVEQSKQILLKDGDEIALLPDSYRYTVSLDSSVHAASSEESVESYTAILGSTGHFDTNFEDLGNSTQSLNDQGDDVIPIEVETPSVDLCVDNSGTVDQEQPAQFPDTPLEDSSSVTKRKIEDPEERHSSTEVNESEGPSNKRSRIDTTEDIKPNIDNINENMQDVAGCSRTIKTEPLEPNEVKEEKPTEPTPKTPREKCQYGSSCYRRSAKHRTSMSHPGDEDWNAPVPCPYGAECYRKNAQHRRSYVHTGPPANRPQPQAGMPRIMKVERNGNVFNIVANAVNFYDDHFEVEDYEGDSVDYDYEF